MNSPNASGWKPEMTRADGSAPATVTGNRALMLEEPLLFEIGQAGVTGVDLPEIDASATCRLGAMKRAEIIDLPGLSEPETVRHYTQIGRASGRERVCQYG